MYNRISFSHKRKNKEILPFATAWMGFEGIMLSEISQSVVRERQILSDLTYMWNLKKSLLEKEMRFVVTRGKSQGVGGRARNWRKLVKRYKLPVTR